MIYFVERADGRVKIGFLRSLYGVGPEIHGGRLIALVEGSSHRLGAIRSLFSGIPQRDGWYLMTSGMFLFLKENAIEHSQDAELRAQWLRIVNQSDNGGRDTRNRQFDSDNVGWKSGHLKTRAYAEPFFDEDD